MLVLHCNVLFLPISTKRNHIERRALRMFKRVVDRSFACFTLNQNSLYAQNMLVPTEIFFFVFSFIIFIIINRNPNVSVSYSTDVVPNLYLLFVFNIFFIFCYVCVFGSLMLVLLSEIFNYDAKMLQDHKTTICTYD